MEGAIYKGNGSQQMTQFLPRISISSVFYVNNSWLIVTRWSNRISSNENIDIQQEFAFLVKIRNEKKNIAFIVIVNPVERRKDMKIAVAEAAELS